MDASTGSTREPVCPERTNCSLLRRMRIERAGMSAWRRLAEFHYRQHSPGIVDKIFAIRLIDNPADNPWRGMVGDAAKLVGVIVYGMPVLNVALRNLATENRYSGWDDRLAALRLLNREVRCINRVVIRPEFRGIGLGTWLVAETLELAGTVLVEALAVMGRVNPFFQRAGMTRYDAPLPPPAVRMIAAFEHAGILPSQLADPVGLAEAIDALSVDQRTWIITEMHRFSQLWLQDRNRRRLVDPRKEQAGRQDKQLGVYLDLVCQHVLSRPAYFLWRRPG